MDLAKSVIVDEQLANGTDNTGIEQCASLIDQIIARIKVVFENVTLRVESYSELCTGIEIQIDRWIQGPTQEKKFWGGGVEVTAEKHISAEYYNLSQ